MIITIIISVVAILELIWIIHLCNRMSFIKWSHDYWVNSYFQEVNKRIIFEHQVEFEYKLWKKRYEKI